MVPGERFRAGGFKRWIYGSDYRDLWNTPIEVAVLDLDSVGGGLTPLRTGGFGQSISLHFTGEDGRRYTVRSLDKDPTKRIWDELKDTIADDFLQNMVSALLPTGALVVDPLMEATGILHSKHTLVVIPDDPRLKAYREEFAGLIGTLQEHPSEGTDNTPGFAGSRQISGTERLREHLEKTPSNRVDARAFLKARLMDFLIGDKDRHDAQWRWARFPDDEGYIWIPIPEDRDHAFSDLDGFVMAVARRGVPVLMKFEDKYPGLLGPTVTGWELDREFLVELDKAAWDSVITTFCTELSDPVIEDAVRKLPQPYYEMVGERLTEALKSRRDALPQFASRYYGLITHQPEVYATDQNEYVQCEHTSSGDLVVRIGLIEGPDGKRKTPYFQRTFRADESREIRIYLRGGDDHVEISGTKGRIVVRIDGGGGDDTFTNASETGASKTRFYDPRGTNRFVKGKGAKIDESPYERPPGWIPISLARNALDWGMYTFTFPAVTVNPDLGTFVRLHHSRLYFGYRKSPFASRHSFEGGVATNGLEPFVSYTGDFRRILPDLDARVHFKYSGIQTIRFNGFGNDTEILESPSFYKVEQSHVALRPSLYFRKKTHDEDVPGGPTEPLRSVLTARLGPILKYSHTSPDANEDKFIYAPDRPVYYGTGFFGQVGAAGAIMYDTRNNPAYPTHGALVRAAGAIYPGVWDVGSSFGNMDARIHTYVTAPIPTTPTLALRVGGKKVWGTYPFHESAFLGGPGFTAIGLSDSHLRGFRKNRFAGDASLYGNVELRLVLLPIDILVPGEFGVFMGVDAGRVFYADDTNDADKWHTGVGGGIWFSFLRRKQTLSIAVINGDDLTGVYLRAGFMF